MIINKMRRGYQQGFTIVEVLIASAVFSLVLLAALAGFMQIGRLFYKGVTIAQTQSVANDIFSDISGNFQTAANVSAQQSGNGYTYYCIGNSRYTFNRSVKIDQSSPTYPNHASGGNFGLLKDSLGGATACAAPCSDQGVVVCNSPNKVLTNPVELLGNGMRLANFSITNPNAQSPNIYNVSIVVAYGDDDLFDDYTSTSPICKSGAGGQFCAVSQVSTVIHRGWRQ